MQHVAGDTETGTRSWTTDRSIAMEMAFSKNAGRPVLLRIRRSDIDQSKIFEGRADEFEWLIAGTISGIEVDPEED
jgi:hypothetical protein